MRNKRLTLAMMWAPILLSTLLLLLGGNANPVPPQAPVLITALYYDGYAPGDADEAFQLSNVSPGPVNLRGWTVGDGEATAVFPGSILNPGKTIWVARSAPAFRDQFGFLPDWELQRDDPSVPDLGGSVPQLANSGDELSVWDSASRLVDTVVYKGGDISTEGWIGASVSPYTPSPVFGEEGQVLYRKLDEVTGRPVPDTDRATDWAQDTLDPVRGRRVRYPGWAVERFFHPLRITTAATLTVAVAPDNLFQTVGRQIDRAQHEIRYYGYTIEHPAIAQHLADQVRNGVEVTLLLEGGPAAGVTLEEKWAVAQIEAAGGRVYFMINDPSQAIHDRYRSYHLKVWLIDDRIAMVGSENPGPGGMPDDDFSNGTFGHRGAYLIIDAPALVEALRRVLDADLDLTHQDVIRWSADDSRFAPPDWFTPREPLDGTAYSVRWPDPLTIDGTFAFEVVSAPENNLRVREGLLGLVGRVGTGDTLIVQQLQEPPYWGPAHASPATDPNLRLEAYIEAARRGARIRILLDRFFDDTTHSRSNAAAVAYVNRTAVAEGLDLRALRGNVTGYGIHSKMVLAQIDGRGYVHVGSLNGGEAANKINREVALQVQSDAAYAYLASVFESDWDLSEPDVLLPVVTKHP